MILYEAPEALATLVAPWAKFYSHSKLAATVVTFLHVAPIIVGGGLAIALDRSTLRVRDDVAARARHLEEIALAHRSVVAALVLSALSGLALLAADLDTFLPSPIFWTKMALIVLLLANGFIMTRTEGGLRAGRADLWRRLRVLAMTSLVLWLVITFVGIALVNAA
jgi:hypothetical protein